MDTVPVDILCEILSKINHRDLLNNRTVCKKWYELFLSKKCLGTCSDFIDMCINNKFLLFDEIIAKTKLGKYVVEHISIYIGVYYTISNKINLLNIGYNICYKYKYKRLQHMINNLVNNKNESWFCRQNSNMFYYGLAFDDDRLLNLYFESNTKYCGFHILKLLNRSVSPSIEIYPEQLVKKTLHNYLDQIIQVAKPNIIKNLYMKAYSKNNMVILRYLDNYLNMFKSSLEMIYKCIGICSSNKIIDIIKNNSLESKILSKQFIKKAIVENDYDLVEYLLKINPKYSSYNKMLRLTVSNNKFRFIPKFNKYSDHKKITNLLLNLNTSSFEKKLSMIYTLWAKDYVTAKIFVQNGLTISVNPRCFNYELCSGNINNILNYVDHNNLIMCRRVCLQ